MILGRNSTKNSSNKMKRNKPRKRITQPPRNGVLREVWRIGWLAASIQLLIALLTYHSSDPSWSTWSKQASYENWMGRLGSIEADLLLQLFGWGAFVLVFLMVYVAVRPAEWEPQGEGFRPIVPAAFLLSLCSLINCTFSQSWMYRDIIYPGGLGGRMMNAGIYYVVGEIGTIAVSSLLLLSAFILLVDRPLIAVLWEKLKEFKEKIPEMVGAAKKITEKFPTRQVVFPLAIPERCPEPPLTQRQQPPTIDISPDDIETTPEGQTFLKFLSLRQEPKAVKYSAPPPKRKQNDDRDFELPPVSLLSRENGKGNAPLDKNWFVEKSKILVEKLNDFGVEGEIVNISPGPVITVYEFKPASGVKIKEIANLSDDLTLALSVLSVRIVAPIPGKPVVGIEIPSPKRQIVKFRELLEETPFYEPKVKIPILLGRLASGEPVVADLSTMPHLLVAGATGTGKSVFINSLITSLLMRFTPSELRMILVDPKMVELSHYDEIPHLLLPVVVDSKKASQALRWTVAEMERRYSLLHKAGVRHIAGYNDKVEKLEDTEDALMVEDEPAEKLPYIVVVIDEYADLMAVVPKEVEMSITRLAQKARASGIHLVLATQRPSTDVVTGLIKANFPSRLSFRVASNVDSKTILDRTGAERLLGNGDLLLHSAGFATLKRMQGAFISDDETEKVVEFLKAQGEPEYDDQIMQTVEAEDEESGSGGGKSEELGKLYDQAVELVSQKGEASISLIQRHLRIGYNRAANLMDVMEQEGVVAPASGSSKRRQVLINQL